MTEALVQWVLLKQPQYLQSRLGFPLLRKLGENYTTEQGRIDFAFETPKEIVVVELETTINNKAKLQYCTDQVQRYQQIKFTSSKPVQFVILFDEANTPESYAKSLREFAQKFNILLRTYSILDIQELYKKRLDELAKTSGLYLGPPVAMDVVYLRWLNRVIRPFYEAKSDSLPFGIFRKNFGKPTNFRVYTTFAKHFELISENRDKTFLLTDYGKRFRDNYNAEIIKSNATMSDLSTEQKRIVLNILTNGNFTGSKINIYYFLRFMHLTGGSWIPKSGTPADKEKLEFVNFLFGKTYQWTTVRELLLFTCNQCEELELVERMRFSRAGYDRAVMTTLGSRVLGFFELHQHLKREAIQIPLQIL